MLLKLAQRWSMVFAVLAAFVPQYVIASRRITLHQVCHRTMTRRTKMLICLVFRKQSHFTMLMPGLSLSNRPELGDRDVGSIPPLSTKVRFSPHMVSLNKEGTPHYRRWLLCNKAPLINHIHAAHKLYCKYIGLIIRQISIKKTTIRNGLVARIHRSHEVPMWPGFDSPFRNFFLVFSGPYSWDAAHLETT